MKSRLKKTANHDVYNRDFAVILINGDEIFEASTHAEAINGSLLEFYDRSFLLEDEYKRPDEKYTTEIFDSIAFAHFVEGNAQHKDHLYVEEYSLQNIDFNTAVAKFKEAYPEAEIYNDDTYNGDNESYERVAKRGK